MLAGTEGYGHGQLVSEWGPETGCKRLGSWGGGQGLGARNCGQGFLAKVQGVEARDWGAWIGGQGYGIKDLRPGSGGKGLGVRQLRSVHRGWGIGEVQEITSTKIICEKWGTYVQGEIYWTLDLETHES